jgi:hypothetical protein
MASAYFNAQGPAELFPGYLVVPTGGIVHYVHASGAAGLDQLLAGMNAPTPGGFFTTLNAAMAQCRANRGDTIVVLPGHTETVSASTFLSSIKAGVAIRGRGNTTDRPKFTWNNAAGNIAISQANVWWDNCQFEMAGDPASVTALTVTSAMTITGNGCKLTNCHFQVGVDNDQIVGLGITVNATKCEIANCTFVGDPTAKISAAGTVIRLTAADQFSFHDNYVSAALTTNTDGVMETLTTASKEVSILDNFFSANGSGNTCAVDFGQALACTGRLQRNLMVVDVDATAGTVVFTVSATANMALLDNFLVNDNNERGLVIGTASA